MTWTDLFEVAGLIGLLAGLIGATAFWTEREGRARRLRDAEPTRMIFPAE